LKLFHNSSTLLPLLIHTANLSWRKVCNPKISKTHKEKLEEIVAITQQIGLQMDDTKIKYTLNRQVGNKVKEIKLVGKKYEKVESFKYLGAMITSLNDI
jgi:hypothetical protein